MRAKLMPHKNKNKPAIHKTSSFSVLNCLPELDAQVICTSAHTKKTWLKADCSASMPTFPHYLRHILHFKDLTTHFLQTTILLTLFHTVACFWRANSPNEPSEVKRSYHSISHPCEQLSVREDKNCFLNNIEHQLQSKWNCLQFCINKKCHLGKEQKNKQTNTIYCC